MAGSPKPIRRRMARANTKVEKVTKGTDLNGREPLGTGCKKGMKKVGTDLNGREPTLSKLRVR